MSGNISDQGLSEFQNSCDASASALVSYDIRHALKWMTGAKMADVKDCTGELQNNTAGVVPVDSGAPQPPARQHQPQGSPSAAVPLKSPTTATSPPGSRPTSHKGAGSGHGLEDSGGGETNIEPFDSNSLADSGKENAAGLAGLSQKDREERLRILRERQNEERQKKLEELKQQALAAQKFREQKEEERRRRIEQLRERDEGRRLQVEERKRQIWEAERDRREAILRKNQEREARIEAKRKNERSSIVFAFGSSTPRMLEPADTGGSFWGSRRATSTTNVMFSSMVGSTGSSGGGDKGALGSGLSVSPGGVPTTSSTSLSRRSSERELIGGIMSASMPAGSKKRAVSAHALDRKAGDELRSSTSMYEVFCWSDLESGVAEGTPIVGGTSHKSTEPEHILSSPLAAPQDNLVPYEPSKYASGHGTAASCHTHPLKDGLPDRNAKLVPFGPHEKVSSSRRSSRTLGTDLWVGQEAVSAGGMIFRGDEGDGSSRMSTFNPYGPSPRARKKTDLMPTIPSPRGSGGDGLHQKGRHKSPGRAFSMTRLDQLARPRTYTHPADTSSVTTNDTHHHHLAVRRTNRELGPRNSLGGVPDRNVSKSTSHLAGAGGSSGQKQVPQERPLRRTDASKSMSHLGASPSQGAMPPLVPRTTRAERLRRRAREVGAAAKGDTGKITPPGGVARSGDATPSSPSRPLSALSVHSSTGSGVSFRHRPHLSLSPASHATPLASPTSAPYSRKPRPISIAITGVSHDSAVSPVGSREIRSTSKTSSDNKSRPHSAAEKEVGAKPPKVPSAKKATPKTEGVTHARKSSSAAGEKMQTSKSATKSSPKASPIHSPAEPAQQGTITEPEEEAKEKVVKEGEVKSEMETSTDGMEKQDEMKPVEGDADEGYVNGEKDTKADEKADLEAKEEKTEEKEEVFKGNQESSQDVDLTASMISRTRITNEMEAKAALAERRRLAREQAEREAELERLRLEEEARLEEERLRKEEEEQRRAEAEQLRLIEEASRQEEQRLQQAIEEAQRREREEALRREEEAKARAEKEEQEKKAREEAERQRQEMEERLKKEEEDRQLRRKRVEAIMLRTRAKAATPTSTPTKGGKEKEDSPSEERKDAGEQQPTQTGDESSGKVVLEGEGDRQETTTGGSLSSSSEPTTTEGSPSNQGTSPGHPIVSSTRNDADNSVGGTNLLITDNVVDPLQAMLNNNGTEISRPKLQTNGHRNGMDFGPQYANVDDVKLNNTANNLLDLSEFDVHLQQTQQLPLGSGGSNAFSYSKQLSHEDNVNSNAHSPPSSMGGPHQPSIPTAPLQTVTGELDTIIPTGSPLQVEDSISSAKRQDKNAPLVDLMS